MKVSIEEDRINKEAYLVCTDGIDKSVTRFNLRDKKDNLLLYNKKIELQKFFKNIVYHPRKNLLIINYLWYF